MTRINRILSAGITAGLMLFGAKGALADDCLLLSGSPAGAECVVNTFRTASGTFNIAEPLRITGTGRIDASSSVLTGITLNVTGNVVLETPTIATGGQIEANDIGPNNNNHASPITINATGNLEMAAGSKILSENVISGGDGGKITIIVGGDMILHGTNLPTPGALISARKISGAGDTGNGGDIYIQVGNVVVVQSVGTSGEPVFTATCAERNPTGDILLEQGAQILADGPGEAGAIRIFAGHDATIRGTVSSRGFSTLGRGGPITIDACCNLLIDDTGIVSSRGQDPGADLVHLEGCCVFVNGLVESTGPGHQLVTSPDKNLCNAPVRPGHLANSSGCVEVWSGTKIIIDSTGTHRGEINADTAQAGGTAGRGWIDLFANGDITINDGDGNDQNGGATPVAAVHANQFVTNAHGGQIVIKSLLGNVIATGFAVQADATNGGGSGGQLTIEAKQNLTFDTASVFARGDFVATGGYGKGGSISERSFQAAISWQNGVGNVQPTGTGITTVANRGTITFRKCTALNTTGTSFPVTAGAATTPTTLADLCVGVPTVSSYVVLPPSDCQERCQRIPPRGSKSGVKFLDLNNNGVRDTGEPGIPGFRIHLFGTDLLGTPIHDTQLTTGDGSYVFVLPNGGTFTVCEEQQPGYTQSYPDPANFPPLVPPNGETIADCTTHTDGGTITPGPWGWTFTMAADDQLTGNDFGNYTNFCEKQPVRSVLDPEFGRFPGNLGPDVIVNLALGQKVQNAVAKATDTNGDGYIIIVVVKDGTGKLGGSTWENVVIDRNFGTEEPPTRFALLGCSVTISAKDSGQAAGLVTSNAKSIAGSPENVFVMDLHGANSGVAGWQVYGDGRYFRNVYNTGSAVGIQLNGNNNTMHNGKAEGNSGDGIQVNGNGNQIETPDSFSNAGCGIKVNGNSNLVDGADVGDKNKGNGSGICVTGNSNTLSENDVYANSGSGITVAGNSNTLTKNGVGDKDKANGGDGINVNGSGNALSENNVFFSGGNGIVVTGNTNTFTKNVSGDSKKGNGLDGFAVAGYGNSFTENKASGNGGYGFNVSGGTVGGPNSLKSNVSNTGSSGGSGENSLAEYLLGNYVRNNGGGNKADGTTVPSATKCTLTFPATNATLNYSPAKACGD